jgi:uncharacterized protein YdaU (DUF1376 family)
MNNQPPASVALWMPWFIKEHRANASTLTHIEHSALCYLLMLFWEHDGSLPNDDKFLSKHLRLSIKQWQAMRPTLLHDCTISGGSISHPKLVAEIAKAKVNVEQKRKAGQASAAARKAQREVNGCSTAVATAVQPRAGNGDGDGSTQPSHPRSEVSGVEPHAREGLRVIDGRQG